MTVRSDEKLRLLLLGREGRRVKHSGAAKPASLPSSAATMRPQSAQKEAEVSSEDEDGRTSIGKARGKLPRVEVLGYDAIDNRATDGIKPALRAELSRSRRKVKAVNYLDEVLAEKAKRHQKKSRRKKQDLEAKSS